MNMSPIRKVVRSPRTSDRLTWRVHKPKNVNMAVDNRSTLHEIPRARLAFVQSCLFIRSESSVTAGVVDYRGTRFARIYPLREEEITITRVDTTRECAREHEGAIRRDVSYVYAPGIFITRLSSRSIPIRFSAFAISPGIVILIRSLAVTFASVPPSPPLVASSAMINSSDTFSRVTLSHLSPRGATSSKSRAVKTRFHDCDFH